MFDAEPHSSQKLIKIQDNNGTNDDFCYMDRESAGFGERGEGC